MSTNFVEGFIDQPDAAARGSSNPVPGQFVPRHSIQLHTRNGVVDPAPYVQIGLDTVRGMPESVQYREIHFNLKHCFYM